MDPINNSNIKLYVASYIRNEPVPQSGIHRHLSSSVPFPPIGTWECLQCN